MIATIEVVFGSFLLSSVLAYVAWTWLRTDLLRRELAAIREGLICEAERSGHAGNDSVEEVCRRLSLLSAGADRLSVPMMLFLYRERQNMEGLRLPAIAGPFSQEAKRALRDGHKAVADHLLKRSLTGIMVAAVFRFFHVWRVLTDMARRAAEAAMAEVAVERQMAGTSC